MLTPEEIQQLVIQAFAEQYPSVRKRKKAWDKWHAAIMTKFAGQRELDFTFWFNDEGALGVTVKAPPPHDTNNTV